MVTKEDLDILRFGQMPNVIVTADKVSVYDARTMHDCGNCGGFSRSRWIALAPSLSDNGYRVVGICRLCADRLAQAGIAVDRRGEDR